MKKTGAELFAEFRLPCNLSVNENGVFFVLKTPDLKKNRYALSLCRIENGSEKPLAEIGSPSYWHCGEKLIYVEKQDEKKAAARVLPETVLRSISYDGRTKREFCKLAYDVGEILFINEGEFYFTATENFHTAEALAAVKGNRRKAEKQLTEDRDYMVFTELPFWLNGAGVTDGNRSRLYRYLNGVVTPVTDEITSVSGLCSNLEKTRIVFVADSFKLKQTWSNRLYCLETSTGRVTDISTDGLTHESAAFLQDGRLVYSAFGLEKYGINQNPDIYIYDFDGEKLTTLYDKGDYSFGNSVNSDISASRTLPGGFYESADRICTLATENDHTPILGFDKKTGAISKINDEAGLVSEAVLWGESFYCVAQRGLFGPDIYRIDMAGASVQLSWINAGINLDYQFSKPIPVCFENEAGDTIYGFAIPPIGCKKGHRYKTVLTVHGGPKTAFGSNLFHEMQYLAACGYAVIYCNPTGSDGRGNRFADIRGKYGSIDFNDLMTFCDRCIEKVEFVDGDNMAIIGGSYGGFMANWAIGHTDRFKAAVSQRSISNWATFTCTSDIGEVFGPDQTGGDVWQSPEKMWEHSPLKYADKVKTPTLFIHSTDDYRCPLSEGISMYSALMHFGVPTRMCVFKGENHELSRGGKPKHRVRRLNEIVAWLDKYLA